MDEFDLNALLESYAVNELKISRAITDGGVDPLWPRLKRAALNQESQGPAMVSRYAIWANTVRDNIIEGLQNAERGDLESAKYFLIRAANSLSAFSELQAQFDPFKGE